MSEFVRFDELGLSDEMLKAVHKKGFEEPTAIQLKTIPVLLRDDTDIIAQAQTGTGKTAAFGLPLLQLVDPDILDVQALVLAPTRELAVQVAEEINSFRSDEDIEVVPIYGGQSIEQQLRRLKRGVHIVVGTPGRVIDHLKRKTLKLENIRHLVLDEADEMLNMGFIEEVEEIMKYTREDKRVLLFSATMPDRIKHLARDYMGDYELLQVKKEGMTTNLTEQIYFEVKQSDKFEALCRIVDVEENFYGLVFCRTRSDVDSLARHLVDRGYDAEAIHGEVSQVQRERTLNRFKNRRSNILVATDVAARGLDVNNLTHVINFALPQDSEVYVHRIGRTGRAGNQGTAITFVSPSEYKKLVAIQRTTKTDIKKSIVPSVEEIIEARQRKITEDVTSSFDQSVKDHYQLWAKELLEERDPVEVLSAVLAYSFEEALDPGVYGEIREPTAKDRQVDQAGKARLFVALGKKDDMNPKKLVDLVLSKVSMKAKLISDIQVLDTFSFITVPFDKAELVVKSFRGKGREKPLITHAKKGKGGSDNRSKNGKSGKKGKRNG